MTLAGRKLILTINDVLIVGTAAGAAGGYAAKPKKTDTKTVYIIPRPTPSPSIKPKFSPAPGYGNNGARGQSSLQANSQSGQNAGVQPDQSDQQAVFQTVKVRINSCAGCDPSHEVNFFPYAVSQGFAEVNAGGVDGPGEAYYLKKVGSVWVIFAEGNGLTSQDEQNLMKTYGFPQAVLDEFKNNAEKPSSEVTL